MIKLRPLILDEYLGCCDCFFDDYGREISTNYGHAIEKVIELTKKDLFLLLS
ncbi:hypothetical protein [Psychromonas sp.]|uniref:hypothetical protein n=1 Tax=Psychromonas sp. TaxID=1884585 RepID=UPI0039E6B56B